MTSKDLDISVSVTTILVVGQTLIGAFNKKKQKNLQGDILVSPCFVIFKPANIAILKK